MRAYCLGDDETTAILKYVRSAIDPQGSALISALEDARNWDAGLIVLSLFVARLLERHQGQLKEQVAVIECLHDPTPSIWLEIQEMDHRYINQLLRQDPGADRSLEEILKDVAHQLAVYDYA